MDTSNNQKGKAIPPPNYGTLDTTDVSNQFWMAHIAPKLASVWKDAPAGTVLGTLTFTKGTGVKPALKGGTGRLNNSNNMARSAKQQDGSKHSISISIAPEYTTKHPDLPPRYTIENLTKKLPGAMHPFTRRPGDKRGGEDGNNNNSNNNNSSNNGNANTTNGDNNNSNDSHNIHQQHAGLTILHGTVTRACHFQIAHGTTTKSSTKTASSSSSAAVTPNDQYRHLCKRRLIENNTRGRVVQPVESSEVSMRRAHAVLTAGKGFGNAVQQHGKSLLEAKDYMASGRKRKLAIAEGQTVRGVIFQLFSVQRFWTIKDLKSTSGLMEREIKPVLSELCIFHKKGDHRNLWELKKEYQSAEVDLPPAEAGGPATK